MRVPSRLHSEFRRWLVAFLFFSTVGASWALATPVLGVPDEPAHTVYAAAAVRGEVWEKSDGPRTIVTVPAGYANVDAVPACYAFQPNVPAGCSPALTGAPGTAEVNTTAGRYPPAYYIYAGLGSLVTDGAQSVYLMRLLTAVLVGAMLASGFTSLLALRDRLLPVLGFGLAVTPMLFFFAGSVNPQAPEIAAAVMLWASGAVLLRRMSGDRELPLTWRNPHLRRTLLAVAALTVLRPLSLFWLALIVTVLLLALGDRTTVPRLLRSRTVLFAVPVLAITAGTTLVWILLRDALAQQDVTAYADLPLDKATIASTAKLNDEITQMIGHFGWLDSPAPGWTYLGYLLALGALAAVALPLLSARQRLSVLAVAVLVLVLPVLLELTSYRESAFAWQGRYTLPLATGLPLLMGLLSRVPRPGAVAPVEAPRPPLGLATVVLTVTATVHVVAFIGALNRNVNGIDGFWGVTPAGWDPPLPPAVLVLGFTVLVAAGAVVARRLLGTADPTNPEPAGHRRPTDADVLDQPARWATERAESGAPAS